MSAADWHRRFMARAVQIAQASKDPSTKVGCLVVDQDHNECASGWNGFPRGVEDSPARLADRPTKHLIVVHAEANAVAAAARAGVSLRGCIAYVTAPCCSQCAALLVQAGITLVVWQGALRPEWEASTVAAATMLREGGVESVRMA